MRKSIVSKSALDSIQLGTTRDVVLTQLGDRHTGRPSPAMRDSRRPSPTTWTKAPRRQSDCSTGWSPKCADVRHSASSSSALLRCSVLCRHGLAAQVPARRTPRKRSTRERLKFVRDPANEHHDQRGHDCDRWHDFGFLSRRRNDEGDRGACFKCANGELDSRWWPFVRVDCELY